MLRKMLVIIVLSIANIANAAVVQGDPQGEITLIEIYDYQCTYCHHMYPVIRSLQERMPQLKIKLMPVALLNQMSLAESSAAIAATAYPGKFDELNNILMQNNVENLAKLTMILQNISLNTKSFYQAIHSLPVKNQLDEGITLLKSNHIESVPVIIIYSTLHPENKYIFQGEQSLETLVQTIEELSYVNKT